MFREMNTEMNTKMQMVNELKWNEMDKLTSDVENCSSTNNTSDNSNIKIILETEISVLVRG